MFPALSTKLPAGLVYNAEAVPDVPGGSHAPFPLVWLQNLKWLPNNCQRDGKFGIMIIKFV